MDIAERVEAGTQQLHQCSRDRRCIRQTQVADIQWLT